MRTNPLLRLIAGTIVVGAVLAVLWQAGVFSKAPAIELSDDGATRIVATAPDLTLTTPPSGSRQVGLRAGDLAPNFEFSDYTGERVRLSDYRGRAVFLNFWATWCPPCRIELPDMETVLSESTDDLAVIAVNNGESFVTGKSYIDEIEVELTAFAYDPEAAIVRRYGLIGMPTSYLIDADGVITRSVNSQMSLNAMRIAVREAIAGYDSIED